MGYINTGSSTSLLAGGSLGASLLFAASKMSSPRSKLFGYRLALGEQKYDTFPYISTGIVLTVACVMGYRFTLSGKMMPAGVTAILSTGVLVFNIIQLNKLE